MKNILAGYLRICHIFSNFAARKNVLAFLKTHFHFT